MTSLIRYIAHKDLDKSKWDRCIEIADNGIIFAYSWYLDAVCDDWDALVLNDYDAVFPITKKSKFGLNYFFNPIFALQLGIFSNDKLTKSLVNQFLEAIPRKLKLIDIQLNLGNSFENQLFEISTKKCQFIDLSSSYEEISKKYSTNLKRNLSKARKQNC
jgi:hypothetical protein